MKKIIIPIIASVLMSYGCKSQQDTFDFKTETEKWKKELVANGVVGNPCREDNDWQKWQEENPKAYFGLQEIQSSESDFNSDGIKDGLFYFPAQNCVGGNGSASDFAMLIFSSDGQLLTNKNITNTIESEIKSSLRKSQTSEVYGIFIEYKGLGKTIIGQYSAWKDEDAKCCPSINGTFEYNPTDFSIEIK